MTAEPATSPDVRDRVLRRSRREAAIAVGAWVLSLLWVVGVSGWLGYREPGDAPPSAIAGIPTWVLWGVLLPWLAATLFSVWFGLAGMTDDALGSAEEADPVADD